MLRSKKWQQLVVLAAQQDLALDVIKYAFIASSSTTLEESDVQEKINPTLLSLVSIFGNSSKDILLSRVLNHILITVPVTVSFSLNLIDFKCFLIENSSSSPWPLPG